MRTIGILGITSLLSLVAPPSADGTRQESFTVRHATAAQRAELEVAMRRFAAAGLALPPVVVTFSDDPADCYGHFGIFDGSATPSAITVCSDLKYVPTHELAHAWLHAHVDRAARRSYLNTRRLERWNDKRDEWSDRGVEDAAFVIQQNLMITPGTPLSAEWVSRVGAYELLTGQRSPVLQRSKSSELGPDTEAGAS